MKYKGRWTARIDQTFELEADSEEEARELLEVEMSLGFVAELLDIEVVELEEDA